MSKDDKILSIQYLRGLAALGVVLCHYSMLLSNYPLLGSALSFGQMGVLIFFFISGFIVTYSLEMSGYKPRQFFTFLIKRSIRIDPPYWATIVLYISLGYFFNNLPSYRGLTFKFNIGHLIAHLIYAVPFTQHPFYYSHVFWTLCVEFQFYILIGLLYFVSENRIYKTIFLLAFGAVSMVHFNIDALIFNYSAIFAFGISFMIFYSKRNKRNVILPVSFICLIAYCDGVVIAFVLLVACVIVMFVTNRRIKLLYFLGDISYSLYLIHSFVGEICNGVFKRLAISQYQLVCFNIELIVALLFAWLLYLLVEKPAIGLSKKFIYQRTFSNQLRIR